MYSWRFEDRTSDVRVTIRRNCLKSLNTYGIHFAHFSIQYNPESAKMVIFFYPVQSKSSWTGLDYEYPLATHGYVLFIWFTWFTIGCVYRYLYRGSQEDIADWSSPFHTLVRPPPPPPSRWWKIWSASGARVKSLAPPLNVNRFASEFVWEVFPLPHSIPPRAVKKCQFLIFPMYAIGTLIHTKQKQN